MKNLTATQFLIYVAVLTVGAAMALPAIPWLRPMGILLIFISGAVVRGENHVRRHMGSLLIGMIILMAAAIVGATQPQGTLASFRPHAWYAAVVVTAWASALFFEYRRWQAVGRQDRATA